MHSSGALHEDRFSGGQRKSATRKVQMERLSIVTSRPFDEVIARIKTSIAHPNLAEFLTETRQTPSIAHDHSPSRARNVTLAEQGSSGYQTSIGLRV